MRRMDRMCFACRGMDRMRFASGAWTACVLHAESGPHEFCMRRHGLHAFCMRRVDRMCFACGDMNCMRFACGEWTACVLHAQAWTACVLHAENGPHAFCMRRVDRIYFAHKVIGHTSETHLRRFQNFQDSLRNFGQLL